MTSRLTVSLANLVTNYATLCNAANGSVAAVVKANAYGLGASEVAAALANHGCRDFFVATHVEGAEIRQALRPLAKDARIFILEGALGYSLETLTKHELTPVLNTLSQIELWRDQNRPAALHVDTGMHRLGIAPAQLQQAISILGKRLSVLISHLARADEPDHVFNQQQANTLNNIVSQARKAGASSLLEISFCNSAGILAGVGEENLGRAGIALYGGNPYDNLPNPMSAVVRLEGQILQLREVSAGTALGYGGTFVTAATAQIATVGLGYADGLPRLLSNCGRVWVNQHYCPIVGRVSMDSVQVDVSNAGAVQEGQWVEFLGSHILVDDVAELAHTISYEIFTGLGARVVRQYSDVPL